MLLQKFEEDEDEDEDEEGNTGEQALNQIRR